MNNFSNEKKEVEEEITFSNVSAEGGDIEFDENIDIDEIQKKLQAHMDGTEIIQDEEVIDEPSEPSESYESPEPAEENALVFDQNPGDFQIDFSPMLQGVQQEVDPKSKKYVIYIDPENVDFIENLSLNDRKILINKILRDQDDLIAAQKRVEQRKIFLRHVIISTLTFIIGFPILFALVNISMDATINSYKQSQKNFSALYRENGKLKQRSYPSSDNFKY